jgi:hypothetical protein
MAIGKIYDSEELKRIDAFMSLKDSEFKIADKQKSDLNKNVFTALIAISAIVGIILSINYIIKK